MARLVDLSHVIEDGMVTYPGLPPPVISDHLARADSRTRYAPGTEFHIGWIEMVANTGTYLDTPFHRYEHGDDLADFALDRVADLPGLCIRVDGPAIGPEALDGLDLGGRAILLATGWDLHWGTEEYGSPEHPHLTEEGARHLADGGAALVGIDSVNIDDTRGRERPAHSILLESGTLIVEHLTGLQPLAGLMFRFFAVPVKVRGMGSFPVRAFALLDG